jgi:NADPH:quinone reductase-like Zn-dependent oxidoreductase
MLTATDYTAGTIHSIGPNTTRFKVGERVLSMSALALRNDHRFGGHQKYTLSTEMLTAHVGPSPQFQLQLQLQIEIEIGQCADDFSRLGQM